jgi:two-component system, OmpR family, phosphate regulon sensor histidine kinase PhoR
MNQSPQDAKDEFLALASHQLRTPATGVKQYIGMLKEGLAGPLTELQQKLIEKAFDSNERQLSIINQMLFVARADSEEVIIDEGKINIAALLQDIVDEQQGTFGNKQQLCTLKIPDENIILVGDEQYLRMAIENVVSNAAKYTPESGSIKITLKDNAKNITIEVRDSGVGVADEDKNLLFKKFSRIPNDLSATVSGSGLGLYLVKKVLEAHHGRVTFKSKPGEGSRVKMMFPKKNIENS